MKRTPGPFRESRRTDAIVGDVEPRSRQSQYPDRSLFERAREVDYYGGHVVAESIAREDRPYFLRALNGYDRLRWTFAMVTVSLLGIIVAGGLWLRSSQYAMGYAAGLERGNRTGYATGLEEGLKLPARAASAPEIGALVLCRTALAEAEDQASECGAAISAAEARGREQGR